MKKKETKQNQFFSDLESREGAMHIAVAVNLTYHGVKVWRQRGIPNKHWPVLIERYKVSADELHAHNVAVRSNQN